jgi:hypothetical protein
MAVTPESPAAFYDSLAADYHLVYGGDWDVAVTRQASSSMHSYGEPAARHCSPRLRLWHRMRGWEVVERTTRHRAITRAELAGAAAAAGLGDICWLQAHDFGDQLVMTGRRPQP